MQPPRELIGIEISESGPGRCQFMWRSGIPSDRVPIPGQDWWGLLGHNGGQTAIRLSGMTTEVEE